MTHTLELWRNPERPVCGFNCSCGLTVVTDDYLDALAAADTHENEETPWTGRWLV